jgi:hypothetical protein
MLFIRDHDRHSHRHIYSPPAMHKILPNGAEHHHSQSWNLTHLLLLDPPLRPRPPPVPAAAETDGAAWWSRSWMDAVVSVSKAWCYCYNCFYFYYSCWAIVVPSWPPSPTPPTTLCKSAHSHTLTTQADALGLRCERSGTPYGQRRLALQAVTGERAGGRAGGRCRRP